MKRVQQLSLTKLDAHSFVIGYDPGGNDAHGAAVMEVRGQNGLRQVTSLQVRELATLRETIGWIEKVCFGGRIIAAGVDTLTEWNTGRSG